VDLFRTPDERFEGLPGYDFELSDEVLAFLRRS
jgi:hypothetical protein